MHTVDVYSAENSKEPAVKNALVYIARTDNEAYVGPAPLEDIAQQIYETYGNVMDTQLPFRMKLIRNFETKQRPLWLERRVPVKLGRGTARNMSRCTWRSLVRVRAASQKAYRVIFGKKLNIERSDEPEKWMFVQTRVID